MNTRYPGPLPAHGRFDYQPITRRVDHAWPNPSFEDCRTPSP